MNLGCNISFSKFNSFTNAKEHFCIRQNARKLYRYNRKRKNVTQTVNSNPVAKSIKAYFPMITIAAACKQLSLAGFKLLLGL